MPLEFCICGFIFLDVFLLLADAYKVGYCFPWVSQLISSFSDLPASNIHLQMPHRGRTISSGAVAFVAIIADWFTLFRYLFMWLMPLVSLVYFCVSYSSVFPSYGMCSANACKIF